jgi:N-acyl amino acid synthase of PEP-CTERM/exosortase system
MSPLRDLDLYDRYFTVVPADSPELLDAAHVLRYQVYCREHEFENPAEHPSGREVDAYDANSVHAVLIQRSGERVVGCVRLILPARAGGLSQLPIRQLLSGEAAERLDACDPLRTAEISRYAVSKAFRRREGEELYPDVPSDDEDDLPVADLRRLAPHLSVGLLRGVATLAAAEGVTTVCAAMAPSLLRLLKRFGLAFEPLGPPIEYHGLRQPCIANCEALLAGLAVRQADYFEVVEQAYRASK